MDGKIYTSIQNHPNVFLKETDIVQQFNFIKNNKKIISSLEGSFNFIHFNKIDGTLEIIRDRWGSKTFFYSIYKNKILFSSSLNGILQDSLSDLSLNKKKLHDFLNYNFENNEETFFNEINRLPPSSFSDLRLEKLKK